MKYKDLKKLNKLELLQLVYAMRSELDKVENENRSLKRSLADSQGNMSELLYNIRNMARQLSKLTGEEYFPYTEIEVDNNDGASETDDFQIEFVEEAVGNSDVKRRAYEQGEKT